MTKKLKVYNHLMDMAFSVESTCLDPLEVPAGELLAALLKRVSDITEEMRASGFVFKEWAGSCSDTYEVE